MNIPQPDEGTVASPDAGRRLDSWKEIATYLKRDVATARRWEKREGLPVHRHQHEKLGSVFAHTLELDAWAEGRRSLGLTGSEDTGSDEVDREEPASGFWRRVCRGPVLPWGVAALALLLAGFVAAWASWNRQPSAASLRLSVDLGAIAALAPAMVQFGDAVVLSPDGAMVTFVAEADAGDRQLYVRRLDELEATALSGTEGAIAPFFSPDGHWIGFFSGGKLRKVAASGGAPIVLADARSTRGGWWGDEGTIVFAPHQITGTRLLSVPSSGDGSVEEVTRLDGDEVIHLWPQILPGGEAMIYTAGSVIGAYNDARIIAQSLRTGARKVVQTGAYHARYVESGHLVFVHDGTLFGVAFDADRLEVMGTPAPLLSGLASNVLTGGAQFSIARNGTLLYLPGPATGGLPIYWMDREAGTAPLRSMPVNWSDPHFSPDGRQLALEVRDSVSHVWIVDWARDTFTRLSRDAENELKPVWTVDGRRIAFASSRGDRRAPNVYWRRTDGTGNAERLTESPNAQQPSSWHPSGRALAFEEINPVTRADVMILPIEGSETGGWRPGKPTAFLNGAYPEFDAAFSPDGRWLSYTSMESGRPGVYVRRYPAGGAEVHIGEGANPVWSRARNELFYGSNGQIMAVDFTVDGGAFRPGRPRLWTEGRYEFRGTMRMFDLHVDGERFALAPAPSGARRNTPVFVTNFFDELRRATSRAR